MIRLIAFDMDGTVLNDEKKILKETKEALEQAARAGIEIVPATGRPFCGIRGCTVCSYDKWCRYL